ncbi:60S ribosomal protein L30 [Trichinella zimbabwensis]|uniref:Large ribosomal subunit protein eL30 n=1 Tax=Trichinella zimbabwensis TaxID=268475 RepID=A0A0V1GXM1_9BILA|nr:60S ribosomal protein L30 [Trichinella zimbabwensis]
MFTEMFEDAVCFQLRLLKGKRIDFLHFVAMSGRMKYTLNEDVSMIEYVLSEIKQGTSRMRDHKGRLFWKKAERLKVTPHSWKSMLCRWCRNIYPKLNEYLINFSSEDKNTLLEFQCLTTNDTTVIHFQDSKPSAFSINESASDEEENEKDKQEHVQSTSKTSIYRFLSFLKAQMEIPKWQTRTTFSSKCKANSYPMAPRKLKKSVENINSRLALVMKSGKYVLGYNQTLRTLRNGKAKLVILANNTPPLRKSEIEYYAMLAKTGVHHYSGNNIELGTACGKYFRVCMMSITDPGDSDIIKNMPSVVVVWNAYSKKDLDMMTSL